MFNIKKILVLGAVVSVAGCSGPDYLFSDETSANQTQTAGQTQNVPTETFVENTDVALLGPVAFKVAPIVSDSFVTQKINTLKTELNQLQSSVENRIKELRSIKEKMTQDSKKYYEAVAEINSRLQMGTTPGNPILNGKWRDATMMLDAVNQDVTAMNSLAAQITADSGMTTYLLDTVRASYNISGAVDEDHNQLKILEDEIIQTAVQNERLLADVNSDTERQQQYISNEKKSLAALAVAIRDGQLYSNGLPATQSMKYRATITEEITPEMSRTPAAKKALVEIRFANENIEFEQPLYGAMQKALNQNPNILFEITGVAVNGTVAKKHVDKVVRSMMNMGVPVNRIRTSTSSNSMTKVPEIKVFVR